MKNRIQTAVSVVNIMISISLIIDFTSSTEISISSNFKQPQVIKQVNLMEKFVNGMKQKELIKYPIPLKKKCNLGGLG